MPKIKFIKENMEFDVPPGAEFLEMHLKNPNIPIKFGCRNGECGTCAIKILQGMENVSKISNRERELLQKKGLCSKYRLACQNAVNGFISIE